VANVTSSIRDYRAVPLNTRAPSPAYQQISPTSIDESLYIFKASIVRRLRLTRKWAKGGGPFLLKDPHGLSPSSWRLSFGPAFNTPLDLKYLYYTETKNDSTVSRQKEWSQGSLFGFNIGSLIYDQAFPASMTWGEKLEAMELFVEIHDARPASAGKQSDSDRDPGMVQLKIYEPDRDSVRVARRLTITQDEFVLFAITGELGNART